MGSQPGLAATAAGTFRGRSRSGTEGCGCPTVSRYNLWGGITGEAFHAGDAFGHLLFCHPLWCGTGRPFTGLAALSGRLRRNSVPSSPGLRT